MGKVLRRFANQTSHLDWQEQVGHSSSESPDWTDTHALHEHSQSTVLRFVDGRIYKFEFQVFHLANYLDSDPLRFKDPLTLEPQGHSLMARWASEPTDSHTPGFHP